MERIEICLYLVGIILLSVLFLQFFDQIYIYPHAATEANEYCRSIGFDQHRSFNRIGIFSKVPVAIKCEYVTRYTDLGVKIGE